MVVLYMVGMGLEQAACAIVGNLLGSNNPDLAMLYYKTISHVSTIMILGVVFFQYLYKAEIVNLYTDIESIRSEAQKAAWLFVFNIFPDLYKGMLKGIIYALAIQDKAVYVHLVCHWMVYPIATYMFAFHYELGI
jgi:Na+-driven multidrug efflux pump